MRGQVVKGLNYFDDKGNYENKALTSQSYCHDQSDFLAKLEVEFGEEFVQRLMFFEVNSYADPNPVKSIHKLTRIAISSQTLEPRRTVGDQNEMAGRRAVCNFRVLSFIEY